MLSGFSIELCTCGAPAGYRHWSLGVSGAPGGGRGAGSVLEPSVAPTQTKMTQNGSLQEATKVPIGKAPYQSRAARPDREGRPGKCEALGFGVGGSAPHLCCIEWSSTVQV